MEKISVVVITYNEERNIERCLSSVQWVDEIVVVDGFSQDRTPEICRRLGATVVQRAWEGFAVQKQFALSLATHPWVLLLDADEEVPAELREEIIGAVSSQADHAGYEIARKSFFLGQWMRHGGWYPGYQMRLFRKESAYINHRPVHEGVEVRGRVGRLRYPLHHYTYYSLGQYLAKMNDYTSLDVMNKLSESSGKRVRWYNFVVNPVSIFVRMYFTLQGFRDGFRGFLLAAYSALYKLLLYAKTWEYQTAVEEKGELPPVSVEDLNSIKKLQ